MSYTRSATPPSWLDLGGKIEVVSKVALKHRDDLSRAYTPGVTSICTAIALNPVGLPLADVRRTLSEALHTLDQVALGRPT